ncbi:helix-turn-helix domain-containing protein [Zhenhengia yiwuensis]|uniref:Helix-turn-helix transcriptional regulator n=1 Tax=Zhenhengia yiwuensis TaxID=2763666 RepID=A0A926IEP9_9FIRM|nr:helix-turn-helix transcriptional regulator [Zhenhengia yiwuensis]MBC8579998.1 helix-turn-helix transcriptional regulator [Zhenhengia yiwuensis]
MQKINNEHFGQFLSQLRKEKELTQKQLAEKLYISDKAVSKWERGLSLPDISLLMPLSKIFDVTITELLSGKRIEPNTQLTVTEVESLMNRTIVLSKEEKEEQNKAKRSRKVLFLFCISFVVLEVTLMISLGYTIDSLFENLANMELLMLIFGLYFTFFTKETLPVYYDENKINVYHDGVFRMNVPGIRFNNNNWKHILKATHTSIMCIFILFPLLYLGISYISPMLWEKFQLFFTLGSVFSMFLTIYIVGKKYE